VFLSPAAGNSEHLERRSWPPGVGEGISEVPGNTFSSTFLGFRTQPKARGFRLRAVAPVPPPLLLRPESTFTRFIPQGASSAPTALCCLGFPVLPHLSSQCSVSITLRFLSWRFHLPVAAPLLVLLYASLIGVWAGTSRDCV